MVIGCLTGNGKRVPIQGDYTFCAPGLTDPLPPDLVPEPAPNDGAHAFGQGALTDGDPDTCIGWRAATVCESGVDIVVRLGSRCFVDHVVLRQPSSGQPAPPPRPTAASATEGIEALGHVEPAGMSCVEVYAGMDTGDAEDAGAGLRMVGKAGQRGPDGFPDGPIPISVGVEAEELVIRVTSYQRDIRLCELQVWGAAVDEPVVFPIPEKMVHLPLPAFVLSGKAAILTGASPSADTRFAATLLAEKLSEAYEITVTVTDDAGDADRVIVVGKPGECDALDAEEMDVPDGPEAYALQVEEPRVCVLASDRRGLVYGVETLLHLMQNVDGMPTAPACLIGRPCALYRIPTA